MIEEMASRRQSRNERRFIKTIDKLVERRRELIEENRVSLEPRLGMLAIHVSTAVDSRSVHDPKRQIAIFQEEGECLREEYESEGVYDSVKLVPKTNKMELMMDIDDREIAGMVTIGHGSIGDLWLPDGDGHFNWEDVAKSARRRVKMGHIIQRTCGSVHKRAVPWGTFAVADQTRISAVIGESIPEEHPPSELFTPVFNTPHNDRKQLLSKMDAYLPTEE